MLGPRRVRSVARARSWPAGADRAHRELRLLQPARARAVRASSTTGRSRVPWLGRLASDRLAGADAAPRRRAPAPSPLREPRRRWRERLAPAATSRASMRGLVAPLDPLRSVNAYGLFAVMTTERPEIELEGSGDGVTWQPVEFRWKPGDARRAPLPGPHMPRLDWQIWFAALGRFQDQVWLARAFCAACSRARRPVTGLLARRPVSGHAAALSARHRAAYHFARAGPGGEGGRHGGLARPRSRTARS